jgi:septal ring factor EnvC (AmiA/AmiB activator)
VAYAKFEKAFLSWLDALDWSTVIDVTDTESIRKIEVEIAELLLSIARSKAQIQILVDALVTLTAPAAALNDRLLKLETQVKTDKAQLEDSQAQLTEAKSKHRDFTDQAIVFAALSATNDLETRTRLRQEIRRKVARIDFWFRRDKKTPHLVPNSKNDLFPFARVTFTNSQQRFIVLVENGFVTLIR